MGRYLPLGKLAVALVGTAMLLGGCTDASRQATPSTSTEAESPSAPGGASGATVEMRSELPDVGLWTDFPLLGLAYRTPPELLAKEAEGQTQTFYAEKLECLKSRGFDRVRYETSSPSVGAILLVARPLSERDAEERGLNVVASLMFSNSRKGTLAFGVTEEESRTAQLESGDQEAFELASSECDRIASESSPGGRLIGVLGDSYTAEVLINPTIGAAQDQWEECMNETAGVAARSLQDLDQQIRARFSVETMPSRESVERNEKAALTEWFQPIWEVEQPIALAVVRCDQESYSPVAKEWKALEEDWVERHSAELNQLTTVDKGAVAQLAAI